MSAQRRPVGLRRARRRRPPIWRQAEIRRAISEGRRAVCRRGRGPSTINPIASRRVAVARQLARRGPSASSGAGRTRRRAAIAMEVAIPRGDPCRSRPRADGAARRADDRGSLNRTVTFPSPSGPGARDRDRAAISVEHTDKVFNVAARDDTYGSRAVGGVSQGMARAAGRIGSLVSYGRGHRPIRRRRAAHHAPQADAYAIFDFPDSFAQMRAALLRTEWDPDATYVTDTLAASALPAAAGTEATRALRGTAARNIDSSPAARRVRRSSSPGQRDPTASSSTPRRSTPSSSATWRRLPPDRPTARRSPPRCARSSARPARKYTWQQLPQAIRARRAGDDIDYEGASGPIDLDRAGDATAGCLRPVPLPGRQARLFDEVVIRGAGRSAASRVAPRSELSPEERRGDPQVVEVDRLEALDLAQGDARHLASRAAPPCGRTRPPCTRSAALTP